MKRDSLIKNIVIVIVLINLITLPVDAADNAVGSKIIDNQIITNSNFNKITPITDKSLNDKEEKISVLATKYTSDFRYSTDLCNSNQCYNGNFDDGDSYYCLNNAEYSGDNYCDNGNWTTRTKILALRMLDLTADITKPATSKPYSLFCDDWNISINYGAYGIFDLPGSDAPNLGEHTEKFCVLTYYPNGNKTVVIGAVLKNPSAQSLPALLSGINKPEDYCQAASSNFNGEYNSCVGQDVWYNAALNSAIFSKDGTLSLPARQITYNFIQTFFNQILNVMGIWPFKEFSKIKPLVENASYFNKLFILQNGNKNIFAVLEKGKYYKDIPYDYLTIDYKNFYSDVCLSVNQYSQGEEYTKCEARNFSEFLISIKTSTEQSPRVIRAWPELTAQIRAKDVPDTWRPKITAKATPKKALEGRSTTFLIYAEISDLSGVNLVAKATIRNETETLATDISFVCTSSPPYTANCTTSWTSSGVNPPGIYYVDIYVEDGLGNNGTKFGAATFEIIERPICMIESGYCTDGSSPVFSLNAPIDAHVAADPDHFDQKMCCLPGTTISFGGSCNNFDRFLFSISGRDNHDDQHIGGYAGFNTKACLAEGSNLTACRITTDQCQRGEECIITLSNPDRIYGGGHATNCDILATEAFTEFPYRVCCTRRP